MNLSKQNGKMQNLKVGFESLKGWIQIPIPKSGRIGIQKSGFESLKEWI